MKYTNKFNLPDTIVRAAYVNDERYDKGKVDRSVTQIIQPPRIDMLRKAHFREIEKDVSEEWWALFGNAVHSILEMGATDKMIVEERLFMEMDGWWISGMIDLQEFDKEGITVSDYKVTTAYALMQEGGVKPEWVEQLNLLALLIAVNKDVRVKANLQIVAIVRDWQRTQAAIDPLYPQAPVVKLNVPLWSMAKQKTFLRDRIRLHRESEMLYDVGIALPYCTDEERWMRDSKWGVIGPKAKKAARVYDNEQDAKDDLAARKPGYRIEYRPGKSVRCDGNFCGVAQWCEQWAAIKAEAKENDNDQAVDEEAG